MTLDSTLSGDNSNSYVTVAYADDYFVNHYNATKSALWATFTTAQKEGLLIHAVILGIENLVFVAKNNFQSSIYDFYYDRRSHMYVTVSDWSTPYKAVSTQKLQFPRTLDIDSNGDYFIPEDVKIAQCEQAIYLAEEIDDETVESNSKGLKAESVTVGPIKLFQEFETSRQIKSLSPTSQQMLTNYLLKNVGGGSVFRA